ncbi:MAG: DUF4363 family protein [Eubacterium sp.]|nr:DUF4363 family protein [Eubacterium sp.]MDE6156396.1 DUF4363 family protein [Eubacterium sp.]MDE6767333.1 DUF4363 family protein [Eubacterium sp.]
MKRLYIALAFLTIAISLCIFEQYTVKEVYKEASAYIDTAIDEIGKQDYNSAESTCKELNDYWDKKQKYMAAMIDHGSLDDASVTISNLEDLAKNKSDSIEEELITAKNQIKGMYDNQRITFGNIF